ncbi:sensor protein PilS [Legionella maceachernii]|uniref:histidine kinase n=1 Tax=Legionella maceachernii TaxID=466 RepID=A0A0W0VXC8_9GAMM|nr:sensor protein PilS [Legionella maceachernii]SKA16083.1 Histidine kinase-, DNA gyrase B-, and HSP90-like ATPase [Legionella maceachernii]SUP01597.1 Sensor protein fixL [Legionella maceachernii]
MYLIIDTYYKIDSLNFSAASFLGRERVFLLNKSFLKLIAGSSKALFRRTIQSLLNMGFKQTCEIELLLKGGERKYIQLECTLNRDKRIHLCLSDITDLHQKKGTISCLEQNLNLANQIIKYTTDAVAALDTNLVFKIVSQPFYKLFFKIFTAYARPGSHLEICLNNLPDRKQQMMNACNDALSGKTSYTIIENNNYNPEVYFYYEVVVSFLKGHVACENLLLVHIRDLTEFKLKEMTQHIQQSQITLSCRLSAMGEMVSALAHEICQPLTAINAFSKSCAYLLNSSISNEEKYEKLKFPLNEISMQAELAGHIIHNMKSLMRGDKLVTETININGLIEDAIKILNYDLSDFKIKIQLALMNNPPPIVANKIHLMQIILNLARNSMEALQTVSKPDSTIIIKSRKLRNFVVVKVKDNGPGIPHQYKNIVLNSYFTTKTQGTGIGLGICRSLIERYGGHLRFIKNCKGAVFYFMMPIEHYTQNGN